MKVIFLGDVVGEPGRDVIKAAVPILKERFRPDLVVVNGENAAGGRGITPKLCYDLMRAGADAVTLGDHAWDNRDVYPLFAEEPRLLRPMNFPQGTPGTGSVIISGNGKKLGVIVAQGRTFMDMEVGNPFLLIDEEIQKLKRDTPCILVDFHAETTSEKAAFGRFLDGKVSAMCGTHTHVQTADEQIFPGGTAFITDVGFTGPHESIIGRDIGNVIQRYRTLMPMKFPIARGGLQADGVFIEIDDHSGRALRIERIQERVKIP